MSPAWTSGCLSLSKILVISRDPQPGDALCHLPAICALADEHDTVYLAFANQQILSIADLPENVVDVLQAEPVWKRKSMLTQTLGVAASIDYCHRTDIMHPTQHLIEWCGLPVPAEVPQPKIRVADVPQSGEVSHAFEVVLAPWTSAPERGMTHAQATELCAALKGLDVTLIGGESDPVIVASPHRFYGGTYPFIVRTMRRARVVVTVDSFPNRLAHAAGIERHIILDSGATPWQWQSHPGAVRVQGKLVDGQATWNIDDIVNTIEGGL